MNKIIIWLISENTIRKYPPFSMCWDQGWPLLVGSELWVGAVWSQDGRWGTWEALPARCAEPFCQRAWTENATYAHVWFLFIVLRQKRRLGSQQFLHLPDCTLLKR